jgi:hypothetical protein
MRGKSMQCCFMSEAREWEIIPLLRWEWEIMLSLLEKLVGDLTVYVQGLGNSCCGAPEGGWNVPRWTIDLEEV